MVKKTTGAGRFIISKNLILMLVILVVILMAVFAWYAEQSQVTASGTEISAKAADNVELALPEKVTVDGVRVDSFPKSNDSWKTGEEAIFFDHTGYLKDLVKDVTSNGKQFVIPNFEAASGLKDGRRVITDDVWIDGLSSKEALTNDHVTDDDQYNYVSLDFYIRSKSKKINVLGDSYLATGSELGYADDGTTTAAKSLVGSNVFRASSYGDVNGSNAFSADAIVGAMRVSLVCAPVDGVSTDSTTRVTTETAFNQTTWDGAAALSFLWLPRPDIYLSTDDNSNNWRLYTGIKPYGNSDSIGSVTLDEIAKQQTYCHSFYLGDIISGNVKKGLTYGKYWDDINYRNYQGQDLPPQNVSDENDDDFKDYTDYFVVSKTEGDTLLGDPQHPEHYPTLGQSVEIVNNALDSSKLIEFDAATDPTDQRDTTGYYVYKCTLNIWVEGEDAEARRSMNNGVFSLSLSFGS